MDNFNLSENLKMVRKVLHETANGYKTYHESFTKAAEEAKEYAQKRGYDINEEDWQREVTFNGKYNRARPKIGKTHRFNIGLVKNGKPQRKALTFTVYGMPHGSFELVVYIN